LVQPAPVNSRPRCCAPARLQATRPIPPNGSTPVAC